MKKIGIGKRALSLLLALTIVLSLVPISAIQAATVGYSYLDSTNLGSDIDTQDTISWPIKVYDFLNDGMLFEYTDHGALASTYVQGTSSSGTYDYLQVATLPSGSGYTNGNSNPFVQGTTLGNDYTVTQGYYNGSTGTYAMRTWGTQTSFSYNFDDNALEVSRSVVAAGSGAPMYLRYSYSGSGTTKSYGWISNFARDDGQYYSTSQVRYLVLVYRTGSSYTEGTVQPYWAVSRSGSYNTDYTWWTGTRGWAGIDISDLCYDSYLTTADDNLPLFGWMAEGKRYTGLLTAPQVTVPASTGWTYLVVDMMHGVDNSTYLPYAYPDEGGTNDFLIANNTEYLSGNCIAGVGLGLPLDASGETMDVAQIAYFGTEEAANTFGESAVLYARNPGTYSGATVSISESKSHYEPTPGDGYLATNFATGYYGYQSSRIYNTFASASSWLAASDTQIGNYNFYTRRLYIDSSSDIRRTWAVYNTYNSSYYDGKWMSTHPEWVEGYGTHYVRYMTLTYATRSIADLKLHWWFSNFDDSGTTEYQAGYNGSNGNSSHAYYVDVPESANGTSYVANPEFVTVTVDLLYFVQQMGYDNLYSLNKNMWRFDSIGLYFSGLDMTYYTYYDSIYLAYCDFFTEETAAQAYGERMADYLNTNDVSSYNTKNTTVTYTSDSGTRLYQTGNNLSYGMFWASGRGTWATNMHGGANTSTNGYYSYVIGDSWNSTVDSYRSTAKSTYSYVVSSSIYQINPYYYNNSTSSTTYIMDTSTIGVDPGYTLYNTVTGTASAYTMGLLEHDLLSETGMDGGTYKVLNYKGDTIAYIAQLLRNTLVIPEYYYQTNTAGGVTYDKLYMYNYISGTASTQYSADGSAITLADALRDDMGIVFTSSNYNGSNKTARLATPSASLGTYAQTFAYIEEYKEENNGVNPLIGPYLSCKPYINTFCDAAYYLLMNLFVDDSYNQRQHTYNYLQLSKALLNDEDKTEAYVFDAGFTYDDGTSAVVYNVANKTIGLASAAKKKYVYATETLVTTANPFLPIYDGADQAGDPYKATGTVYYFDEGALAAAGAYNTYVNRNYNYTLQANGEFIYHYDDDLYFDFEGDDDVYLFINGELVLDIGGAHSIAKVAFNMNDYVDAARDAIEDVLVSEYGFEWGTGEDNYEEYLDFLDEAISDDAIDESEREDYIRYYKLALQEGESYDIDFYYMERHGWGANMRIATNIVMSDPSLATEKTAYQGYDEDGDLIEVPYGSLVDDSQPLHYEFATTNNGNLKLYNLSFMDAQIGVNLSYDRGLEVYGKATTTQFTSTSSTTLQVLGLDGAFQLDGTTYYVNSSGSITDSGGKVLGTALTIAGSTNYHTLKLYQYGTDLLFTDVTATVVLGGGSSTVPPTKNSTTGVYSLSSGYSNQVPVAGIRVTDADGGPLEVEDLTITVDGYASLNDYEAGIKIETLDIYLSSNEELMAFLHNLESEDGTDSGDGGEDSQYSGDGMWPHATITISGIRYSLSAEEQDASSFVNTLYNYGYQDKVISDTSVLLRSQDQHKVYFVGGEPMYYHWAGHVMNLQMDMIWADAVEQTTNEDNVLYESAAKIQAIVDDAGSFPSNVKDLTGWTVELCDQKGNTSVTYEGVEWVSDLYYAKLTYETTGVHVFYLKVTYGSTSVVVPVTVYSVGVTDSVFVMDYGLSTADLNANGKLFAGDELLGGLNNMTAMLMGIYSSEPNFWYGVETDETDDKKYNPTGADQYSDFWYSLGANTVYRTQDVFLSEAGEARYEYKNQGTFYMSKAIPDEGLSITYDGAKYTLDAEMTFTPTKFMDEAYSMYLFLSVHESEATFHNNVWHPHTSEAYYMPAGAYQNDPGTQVKLYKKLTVLPANVVYYEDDFADITYSGTAGNFTHYGNGSGSLMQTAENGVYGQDEQYQKSSNAGMSGESLTTYKITGTETVASFTFTGTGFEIVGRTNASDAGTMVVKVTPEGASTPSHYFPVITEFDNGNDGGAEAINQVPIVRIDGLDHGTYTVELSGNPAYDFSNWDGNISKLPLVDSYLYIDGVRIFQPMGATNDNYNSGENGAVFYRVRDQILSGHVGVATLTGTDLEVSYGTVTWTEDFSGDFGGDTSFTANQVASADDYLIKGPNNEVYMEGSVSNSALVMYVQRNANTASLQIAARALDYAQFYGASSSSPAVELQCGIYTGGKYSWQKLATITSSTEQYYKIPLENCPVVNGVYQVVLRAVAPETGDAAMVSYSTIKAVNVTLVEDEFADLATTKQYVGGVLVDGSGSGEVSAASWNFMDLQNQMVATRVYEGERVKVNTAFKEYPVNEPALKPEYASLSFEDEIRYNIYFTASNLADVKEMGMLVFDSELTDGTIANAAQVLSDYNTDGTTYMVQTDGIAAKKMGDTMYFKVYAKLVDGSYVYSDMVSYSAVKYANTILAKSESTYMKALVVSMLNYGAEAQKFFAYNTDNLMNAALDADAQALVSAYSEDTMPNPAALDETKNGIFTNTGFGTSTITASFDSAFALNYYFNPLNTPDGNVYLYYWNEKDYAAADQLSANNATGSLVMIPTGAGNQYWAKISGIAAKEMSDTIYVGGIYTADGVTYSTRVMNYSMGRYCDTVANKEGSAQQELSKATAVYGACAKDYFDSL